MFLFTSCSEDDSTDKIEENAKESIIGNWIWIKAVNENGEMDFSDCPSTPSFNFYNNGDLVKQFCGNAKREGEYLVTGNILELQHDPNSNYNDVHLDRMRATIEKITAEEMILDLENGYLGYEGKTVKLYLEKVN